MTTNFTSWLNVLAQAWPDNVTDCETSQAFAMMKQQPRFNVQRRKIEEVTLAAAATYTISQATLTTSQWHLLMITCRPAVSVSTGLVAATAAMGYVTTVGKAADNSTTVTGVTPLYGAGLVSGLFFPGLAVISTYNQTAEPVITSQANGSVFTIYDLLCVEDGS